MVKAVIIDDEQHCIDRLGNLLKTGFADMVEIAGSFTSVEESLKKVQGLKPDVVFLDVEIGGKTGFDFLQGLPEPGFEIIFTTAHDKYAVQAFKFSALDYLLKPVDREGLKYALEKLKGKISQKETASKLDVLYHNLKAVKGASKKICVPDFKGFAIVNVSDIVHCMSKETCTTLYLKDKLSILSTKPLKEFEEMLTDYHFFRVHTSHLVNLNYIKSYNKDGTLVMEDGSEIGVSTRRKNEFLKRIAEM